MSFFQYALLAIGLSSIVIVLLVVYIVLRRKSTHPGHTVTDRRWRQTGLGNCTELLPPSLPEDQKDGQAGGDGSDSDTAIAGIGLSHGKAKGKGKARMGGGKGLMPAVDVDNFCTIPTCVRCHNYRNLTEHIDAKLATLSASGQTPPSELQRLVTTLRLGLPKYATPFPRTGHVPGCTQDYQQPTVLQLPGLVSQPLPEPSRFPWLSTVGTSEVQQGLGLEFYSIANHTDGWIVNNTPSGQWAAFYLYNQGIRQDENCQRCPFTTQLLEQIDDLMTRCVFGNAFFSIISPGTHIAPHCGPTNVRLRTHVPIFTPAYCVLNVAGETTTWEDGKPFVFDDSFAHEVVHYGHTDSNDRVVLIFDTWHPEVTAAEREAITRIFAIQ